MTFFSFNSLKTPTKATSWFELFLAVAKRADLAVETWRVGDPTRTLGSFLSEGLETLSTSIAGFANSVSILDAEGEVQDQLGEQLYNVTRAQGSFASGTLRLELAAGAAPTTLDSTVILESSVTGKRYAVQGSTLATPAIAVSVPFTALERGSESSVAANEVDKVVDPPALAPLLTVVDSNPATGEDSQSQQDYAEACLLSLATIAPTGTRDAYQSVAQNETLTGVAGVLARANRPNNTSTRADVYVRGTSQQLDLEDAAKIEEALYEYAVPLTLDVTVRLATPVIQSFTFALSVKSSSTLTNQELQIDVTAAMQAAVDEIPIGGFDDFELTLDFFTGRVTAAVPDVLRVDVLSPQVLSTLSASQYYQLGSVFYNSTTRVT